MFRCCCFLFVVHLFLTQPLLAQATTPDSVHAETTRENIGRTVRDYQDSVNRERLFRHIEKHGKSLDVYLAERKEEEKKEERRRWFKIGAGAVFLFALFFAIARRSILRKRKTP